MKKAMRRLSAVTTFFGITVLVILEASIFIIVIYSLLNLFVF